MKVEVLEDFDLKINDHSYKQGQILDVTELEELEYYYGIYRYEGLDWIPKNLVKIL